jgi:hypothetical protein
VNGNLDQAALSAAYQDSDWEKIADCLHTFLKEGGEAVSREDRIFAFKYLGVIYAADSTARPKAESYFTRLLALAPRIEIVDMLPSKRVNDLFREVKSDHLERKNYSQRFDEYGNEADATSNQPNSSSGTHPSKNSSGLTQRDASGNSGSSRKGKNGSKLEGSDHSWLWWTLGLTAVAGAGAGAYFLSVKEDKDDPVVIKPPDPGSPLSARLFLLNG